MVPRSEKIRLDEIRWVDPIVKSLPYYYSRRVDVQHNVTRWDNVTTWNQLLTTGRAIIEFRRDSQKDRGFFFRASCLILNFRVPLLKWKLQLAAVVHLQFYYQSWGSYAFYPTPLFLLQYEYSWRTRCTFEFYGCFRFCFAHGVRDRDERKDVEKWQVGEKCFLPMGNHEPFAECLLRW